MPTRKEVDAALWADLRKTFRDDAGDSPITADFDAEIVAHDSIVELELEVYVKCEEHDQESAAILVHEEWWPQIREALSKRLGVDVQANALHIHW